MRSVNNLACPAPGLVIADRAALLHVVVRHERERSRLARPVARRAVVKHDRRDVFGERQFGWRLANLPGGKSG